MLSNNVSDMSNASSLVPDDWAWQGAGVAHRLSRERRSAIHCLDSGPFPGTPGRQGTQGGSIACTHRPAVLPTSRSQRGRQNRIGLAPLRPPTHDWSCPRQGGADPGPPASRTLVRGGEGPKVRRAGKRWIWGGDQGHGYGAWPSVPRCGWLALRCAALCCAAPGTWCTSELLPSPTLAHPGVPWRTGDGGRGHSSSSRLDGLMAPAATFYMRSLSHQSCSWVLSTAADPVLLSLGTVFCTLALSNLHPHSFTYCTGDPPSTTLIASRFHFLIGR